MSDYERIKHAINYICSHVCQQPSLEDIAGELNLSSYHFQRLFSRWAGVSPKRFLQILTVERAKLLLVQSKSILEVSDSLGLSSGSRLYDHFIQLEAMTPGEFKNGGNLTVEYAMHGTPFGAIFIAMTRRGICKLDFVEQQGLDNYLSLLKEMWPHAKLQENRKTTRVVLDNIFCRGKSFDRPLSLYVTGTNFQINVWRALLQIPSAKIVSYSQVATAIGKPKAARAVGTAIAANPVAFVIPCHRVLQQSGKLGGYRWGETRMHAIHAWETARFDEKN